MSDYKLPKEKHLTEEAREEIQKCLESGVSFKDIARRVGKSSTTISREVKKHLVMKEPSVKRTKADGTPIVDRPCPKLIKPPFVCNGCEKSRYQCSFQKQFYYAKAAHREYETLLVEAREGIPLNKQAFYDADALITQKMKKGQRLYHIMQTDDVGFSMSSAYRYLHKDYLSVKKLDFPRVVKFKARKQYRVAGVPKAARVGRTYADFIAHTGEHEINHWVEMDTVIGRIGGKVIMTFHFTRDNFMFGLLLDDKSSAEATNKIRDLKKRLKDGGVHFGDVFPVLLTDNGGEFSNVAAFTDDCDGLTETRMYFCDPYRSSQKPNVEKNHTVFRDIVPKGESFDHFTQDTVDLIFSHVNGVFRKVLGGKSPYDLFSFMYGDHLSALLGISYILANDVVQSPLLLKASTKTPLVHNGHTYPGMPYSKG
jgi:IS30 family transposase